jgi:hypothetical protein
LCLCLCLCLCFCVCVCVCVCVSVFIIHYMNSPNPSPSQLSTFPVVRYYLCSCVSSSYSAFVERCSWLHEWVLGLDILDLRCFLTGFSMFSTECVYCCFALPCTPPRIVMGGFAISVSFLLSFVHTGADASWRFQSRSTAFSLAATLWLLFRLLFRIHLSAAGLSVTTFQLVWRFLFRSALPPPLFLLPWVAEASIQCNFSAASHSALVHLGAGRGITFGGVVVHLHLCSSSFSFCLNYCLLLLLFC